MQISTSQFTYKNRVFSASASDFPNPNDLFQPNFPIAQTLGFELVSERTGAMLEMMLIRNHYDGEGDLTHWRFMPCNSNAFDTLIVFND
jgi:hypothetical protein